MKSFYTNTAERLVREVEHDEEAVLPTVEGLAGPLTLAEVLTWAITLPPPPPDPLAVPSEVPRWALRAVLDEMNKLNQIDAALNTIPGKAGSVARRQWAECLYVERYHPMTAQIGAVIGLTDSQMDDLFREAATLY